MSKLLVTLQFDPLSLSWLVPATWATRVQRWTDSFTGSGWRVISAPEVSAVRAVVLVEPTSGVPVEPRQLASLRANWSERTGGVYVASIDIVEGEAASRQRAEERLHPDGPIESLTASLGDLFGDLGKAIAVPVVVLGTIGIAAYYGYRAFTEKR